MIFVTVGTQKFQMDRLFYKLDKLVEEGHITDTIVAQIGYSRYQPKNFKTYKMLDSKTIHEMYLKSSVIITHGGTSSIISALKLNKKVIAIPRQKKYQEHVDDHQIEIVSAFKENNFIAMCTEVENLLDIYHSIKSIEFRQYDFNNEYLKNDISNYLEMLSIKMR
ncbi:PssE/Cps14G family polysaccharide biosynthesis glycosyltransferase [Guptibacillus hwajinpoensis]|uniref:PssE/Cps14G family polysaccharide biosynthesis glycosyltransferase n=1 Tax=Guptibacillus hwajinpoensis TaxID=208199 RepID=UPI001CFCC510|nr:PssE/Cps14G family polysaccharide biosynthesis glycosyltransferase [Pseudalkalibacillus hwajinpoensis]WLR61559.1 PssE/Cps14G family polysaccharide biosynthesis glycosyltransferase [Pseudalkalibacillus hwajinpoensis]